MITSREELKCQLLTYLKRGGDKMIPWKPTHQSKTPSAIDVMAWQFLTTNPLPSWVFKNFHNLDAGMGPIKKLTHRSGVVCNLGDWIVRSEDTIMHIFTDEEFNENFRPIANGK
jgi:hypothetical protein